MWSNLAGGKPDLEAYSWTQLASTTLYGTLKFNSCLYSLLFPFCFYFYFLESSLLMGSVLILANSGGLFLSTY